MISLILVLASLLIFAVYNTVALNQFGVPKSLSMTYYLWEEKKSWIPISRNDVPDGNYSHACMAGIE